MHIANIPDMREKFRVPVGLSDHSAGDIAASVAVSMGACVVEKHMCLSRSIPNPDAAFSMEPAEFKKMVDDIRDALEIKGSVQYGPTEKEEDNLKFRRSLFAVKEIHAGDTFTEENVRSIRPSNGLKPIYLKELLGKKAKRDIPYGMPILEEDL